MKQSISWKTVILVFFLFLLGVLMLDFFLALFVTFHSPLPLNQTRIIPSTTLFSSTTTSVPTTSLPSHSTTTSTLSSTTSSTTMTSVTSTTSSTTTTTVSLDKKQSADPIPYAYVQGIPLTFTLKNLSIDHDLVSFTLRYWLSNSSLDDITNITLLVREEPSQNIVRSFVYHPKKEQESYTFSLPQGTYHLDIYLYSNHMVYNDISSSFEVRP